MNTVYFIGIGGIGMSALARYFKFKGYAVAGYDRTPSPLTAQLQAEGISVHYEDRPDLLPARDAALVIYTPAVPDDLGELVRARTEGYRVVKRSQALGEITRGQRCIAIAGTHGKTTTSTLTAHLITQGGGGCSAFLGGISRNYGTNLLMSRTETAVVEADEFDRSFLQLHPELALITSVDPDHLDIYGDYPHVVEAFRAFAAQVSGTLIVKTGIPVGPDDTRARVYTYHLSDPSADFHARGAAPDATGHFHFDLVHPGGVIEGVRAGAPGRLNAENSVAAAALALTYGMDPTAVKAGIGTFEGVKRRLEVQVNRPGCAYIDDYAHHPAELSGAIASLRDIFPGRKLTAIFQPHLFTRTRDFAPGFAEALSQADKLILLDIYPAREAPIPGVSSDLIFRQVTAPEKVLLHGDTLLDYLKDEPVDVLVTFGAGNIDRLVEPIRQLLETR